MHFYFQKSYGLKFEVSAPWNWPILYGENGVIGVLGTAPETLSDLSLGKSGSTFLGEIWGFCAGPLADGTLVSLLKAYGDAKAVWVLFNCYLVSILIDVGLKFLIYLFWFSLSPL